MHGEMFIPSVEEFVVDGAEYSTCEVVNTSSLYFGKSLYVTHSAYAAGKQWFKSAYPVADGVFIWFSRNELEFD